MWDDPILYELEYADDPTFDLEHWLGLAERRGARRVLELGCGTGRVSIPLARAGLDVTGLDYSASFLERAREHAAAEPDAVRGRLHWVQGDMRDFALEADADLVIVPYHSLQYLHTLRDQLACLGAARAALSPGGAFAFDVLMPRMDFLAEALSRPPLVRLDADHAAPELGAARVLRRYSDRYDPAGQTLHSTNMYEIHWADGRVEHRVADLDWHMYFPRELELLLATAGFTPVERRGGYAGEPWDDTSSRCLWACEAR